MAFAGGYLAAKLTVPQSPQLTYLTYTISAIIPCISYYFIALYRHNDMHIGLLHLLFRKIEEEHADLLGNEVRFYAIDGFYKDSFDARKISHRAIYLLCLLSPMLIITDSAIAFFITGSNRFVEGITNVTAIKEFIVFLFALIFVCSISLYNITLLRKAQEYRDSLQAR